jgi:hypothetical protein
MFIKRYYSTPQIQDKFIMKKIVLLALILGLICSSSGICEENSKLSVGKGSWRVGVMGSLQFGRLAKSFYNDVNSFAVELEGEYFLFNFLAPVTRIATNVYFVGDQSITDLVWGLGAKGIFNFGTRYLPYIKFIPSFHFFDVNTSVPGMDSRAFDFDILGGLGLDILLTKNVAVGFAFNYEVIFSNENLAVYSIPVGFSFYF